MTDALLIVFVALAAGGITWLALELIGRALMWHDRRREADQ